MSALPPVCLFQTCSPVIHSMQMTVPTHSAHFAFSLPFCFTCSPRPSPSPFITCLEARPPQRPSGQTVLQNREGPPQVGALSCSLTVSYKPATACCHAPCLAQHRLKTQKHSCTNVACLNVCNRSLLHFSCPGLQTQNQAMTPGRNGTTQPPKSLHELRGCHSLMLSHAQAIR